MTRPALRKPHKPYHIPLISAISMLSFPAPPRLPLTLSPFQTSSSTTPSPPLRSENTGGESLVSVPRAAMIAPTRTATAASLGLRLRYAHRRSILSAAGWKRTRLPAVWCSAAERPARSALACLAGTRASRRLKLASCSGSACRRMLRAGTVGIRACLSRKLRHKHRPWTRSVGERVCRLRRRPSCSHPPLRRR